MVSIGFWKVSWSSSSRVPRARSPPLRVCTHAHVARSERARALRVVARPPRARALVRSRTRGRGEGWTHEFGPHVGYNYPQNVIRLPHRASGPFCSRSDSTASRFRPICDTDESTVPSFRREYASNRSSICWKLDTVESSVYPVSGTNGIPLIQQYPISVTFGIPLIQLYPISGSFGIPLNQRYLKCAGNGIQSYRPYPKSVGNGIQSYRPYPKSVGNGIQSYRPYPKSVGNGIQSYRSYPKSAGNGMLSYRRYPKCVGNGMQVNQRYPNCAGSWILLIQPGRKWARNVMQ
jgi:hypothetical protein